MRNQVAADFDFEAAGYQEPADWARLHDLIPRHDLTLSQRTARAGLKAKDTKANVCALLKAHNMKFNRVFDAKAAAKRNASI